MKRILLLTVAVCGIACAVRALLEGERREQLARLPATMMERGMEMMPENSPPRVMMSSLSRLQEQNEETLSLLREQSELLRERQRL